MAKEDVSSRYKTERLFWLLHGKEEDYTSNSFEP